MDRNRNNEHLGVNKLGKNIRKSPLHQPSFGNNNGSSNSNNMMNNGGGGGAGGGGPPAAAARQQPQPHVYNISKNDFRSIVQQLTGSPSHEPLPTRPGGSPKPPSTRLQRIRPPPLAPMNRPPPVYPSAPPPGPMVQAAPQPVPAQGPYNNNNNSFMRPGQYGQPAQYGQPPGRFSQPPGQFPQPGQFGQPSPSPWPPVTPVETVWANTAESPISAYMRYLQNSIVDSAPRQPLAAPQYQQGPVHSQPLPLPGLLPNPGAPQLPSPRMNGAPLNSPGVFPSPTSQFVLPSPSGYLNLASPRSPYPLLSPGMQYPPPFTPSFPYSPMAQSGILGPGPQFPPPSPGFLFPLSPSFFTLPSPRWRDH